ncbi:hypothetical protein GCM10009678_02350 [Actinomadura kijaniata]|uniref:DUF397 domain-containing protein n=1 Tax=Actinomadura namibiensis TaxID=182080 RepID=A0A7W3QPH7_ACTNM|nr:DUF397 domain-containing protein [Actinomadura namibiensis]MBA8954193.1 hypothetical protein [Actinomadura namibiensis]
MGLRITAWRKASRSTENGGHCIEVAGLGEGVGIRDSKDPGGPMVLIGREEAQALAVFVKSL